MEIDYSSFNGEIKVVEMGVISAKFGFVGETFNFAEKKGRRFKPNEAMSTRDVCEALDISPHTLQRLVTNGELKAITRIRAGGRFSYTYSRHDVEQFKQKRGCLNAA